MLDHAMIMRCWRTGDGGDDGKFLCARRQPGAGDGRATAWVNGTECDDDALNACEMQCSAALVHPGACATGDGAAGGSRRAMCLAAVGDGDRWCCRANDGWCEEGPIRLRHVYD